VEEEEDDDACCVGIWSVCRWPCHEDTGHVHQNRAMAVQVQSHPS